jgi:hypothetical protein
MENIRFIFLAAAGAFLFQFFLPWWSLSIPCLAVGFLYGTTGTGSFLKGFLAVALLWTGAAFIISYTSGSSLPVQISGLFPGKAVGVIYLITALVGGLTGGFSALTGQQLRKII